MLSQQIIKEEIDTEKYGRKMSRERNMCFLQHHFENAEIFPLNVEIRRTMGEKVIDEAMFFLLDSLCGIFEGFNFLKTRKMMFYLIRQEEVCYLVKITKEEMEMVQIDPCIVFREKFTYGDWIFIFEE